MRSCVPDKHPTKAFLRSKIKAYDCSICDVMQNLSTVPFETGIAWRSGGHSPHLMNFMISGEKSPLAFACRVVQQLHCYLINVLASDCVILRHLQMYAFIFIPAFPQGGSPGQKP